MRRRARSAQPAEAARGSGEISAGIVKVAEIARDTAGSSENTQKAAEELARLAAELRGLTQRFRYSTEETTGDAGAQVATAAPATMLAMAAVRSGRAHRGVDAPAEGPAGGDPMRKAG